jgi:carbon storage regulator CsrA
MLVITRKDGEELVIPECGLTITVLECRDGRVRVGVSGSEARVYRRELWDRIQRNGGLIGNSPSNTDANAVACVADIGRALVGD